MSNQRPNIQPSSTKYGFEINKSFIIITFFISDLAKLVRIISHISPTFTTYYKHHIHGHSHSTFIIWYVGTRISCTFHSLTFWVYFGVLLGTYPKTHPILLPFRRISFRHGSHPEGPFHRFDNRQYPDLHAF